MRIILTIASFLFGLFFYVCDGTPLFQHLQRKDCMIISGVEICTDSLQSGNRQTHLTNNYPPFMLGQNIVPRSNIEHSSKIKAKAAPSFIDVVENLGNVVQKVDIAVGDVIAAVEDVRIAVNYMRDSEKRSQIDSVNYDIQDNHDRQVTSPTVSSFAIGSPAPLEDLCNGHFDASANIGGKINIFKNGNVYKYSTRNSLDIGYPKRADEEFPGIPLGYKIDAVYERFIDKMLILFSGPRYIIYVPENETVVKDSSIADFGISDAHNEVDVVILRSNKTYLFSGQVFWRYNEELRTPDEGYPKSVESNWKGLKYSGNLDAGFTDNGGVSYFFKGHEYWEYDNKNQSTSGGCPRRVSAYWFSCSPRLSMKRNVIL